MIGLKQPDLTSSPRHKSRPIEFYKGEELALKAITITADNVNMLANRFAVEDVEDVLPLTFILVTEFGNDETFDVLTKARFDELFLEGDAIDNGFHAIEAR